MLRRVLLSLVSFIFASLAFAFDAVSKNSIGPAYEQVSFDYTVPFSQFFSHEEKVDGALFGLQFEHKNRLDIVEYRLKLNYLFSDNLRFVGKAKFNYPFYSFETETRDKYKASKLHISSALFVKPKLMPMLEKLPRLEKLSLNLKPGLEFGYNSYSLQNNRRFEELYFAPAVSLSFLDRIDLTFYLKQQRNNAKVFDFKKDFATVTPAVSLSLESDKVSFNFYYEKRKHEKFKAESLGGSILFRF